MLKNGFKTTCLFLFLLISTGAFAQQDASYQTPPKAIQDLVLSKPTPGVSINSNADWLLLMERSDFPDIAELAEPELRIAGLRINPANFGPTRSGASTNLQLKHIK